MRPSIISLTPSAIAILTLAGPAVLSAHAAIREVNFTAIVQDVGDMTGIFTQFTPGDLASGSFRFDDNADPIEEIHCIQYDGAQFDRLAYPVDAWSITINGQEFSLLPGGYSSITIETNSNYGGNFRWDISPLSNLSGNENYMQSSVGFTYDYMSYPTIPASFENFWNSTGRTHGWLSLNARGDMPHEQSYLSLEYTSFTETTIAVPEPASLALFASGGLLLLRRRRVI